MAIQIQLRRGTTEDNRGFTGAPGEVTMDTQQKNFRIHDGSTMGGWTIDKSEDIVHRTGNKDETITGSKTFTSQVKIKTTTIDQTVVPTEIKYGSTFSILDNNNKQISYVSPVQYTDGTIANRLGVCREVGGAIQYSDMQIRMSPSGVVSCYLPNDVYATTFHGNATSANWADLAENYESDEKYSVGTLIRFGGEKDITIAKINCNGVISDKPGYLLDAELENSQPVALAGKTPVRVIGKIKKFDRIVLSEIPGVGKEQTTSDEKVIAIALEDSDIEEEKLVLCVTKFNLD